MNYWHNFEDPSKKRKNNNQTHRGRPPGVAEDGGANFSLFLTYNRIGVPYGHDFFNWCKELV